MGAVVALAAVAGVVVGALVAVAVGARRAAALRAQAGDARRDLAVSAAQLSDARETLERERAERADAMRGLETAFKSLSQDVLDETVARFRVSQEDVTRERDARLDKSLEPLAAALAQYQRSLAEYNRDHTGALHDVRARADLLLEAQAQVQETTSRLGRILGRGDQRGRWGEYQLVNVLEASGLRKGVDYELQVTESTDEGRRLRPDCVVHLPNDHQVVIDAKFPFDAFEQALEAEDADERARRFAEHAEALRKHVRALRERGYWKEFESPEFVVCFVPSDHAIAAALDADPRLLTEATTSRVLLAGPTNLFSLLWSVAMIVGQHQAIVNAEAILGQSQEIINRIQNVYTPVERMGRSLRDAVARYNEMVASVESRLGVTARRIAELSGAPSSVEAMEISGVDVSPRLAMAEKWGLGDGTEQGPGEVDVIELEAEEG